MDPTTPDAIEPPANVLVLHSTRRETNACSALLEKRDDRREIWVSFDNEVPDSPGLEGPDRIGVVSIGDVLRADRNEDSPDFTAPVSVDVVADPNDMSQIGVAVSRYCEYWGSDDAPIALCFDSLDHLLRQQDPKQVFQFCHVLTKRLTDVGANAHFHLDPTAFDDQVVGTFASMFDEVVADRSASATIPEASDADIAGTLGNGEDSGSTEFETSDDEASDDDVASSIQ